MIISEDTTPLNERQKPKKSPKAPVQNSTQFYRRLFNRVTHDKSKAALRKNLSKFLEKSSHSFKLYPWYLWVAGGLIVLFCLVMTGILYRFYKRTAYQKFLIFVNVGMYYLGFFLLYVGKIEVFCINRKKGLISRKKTNIFCSKTEIVEKFDNVDYIQICMKGTKKGAYDNRKYFIRVNLKQKAYKPIEFGFTWDFNTITLKYQICLAMIKGMIVDKVEEYSVKDESKYPDFYY